MTTKKEKSITTQVVDELQQRVNANARKLYLLNPPVEEIFYRFERTKICSHAIFSYDERVVYKGKMIEEILIKFLLRQEVANDKAYVLITYLMNDTIADAKLKKEGSDKTEPTIKEITDSLIDQFISGTQKLITMTQQYIC